MYWHTVCLSFILIVYILHHQIRSTSLTTTLLSHSIFILLELGAAGFEFVGVFGVSIQLFPIPTSDWSMLSRNQHRANTQLNLALLCLALLCLSPLQTQRLSITITVPDLAIWVVAIAVISFWLALRLCSHPASPQPLFQIHIPTTSTSVVSPIHQRQFLMHLYVLLES